MVAKKRGPDPPGPDWEIFALMGEEEQEKLLRRGQNSERDFYPEEEIPDERQMISQMMARPSWLWLRDFRFVKSVSQQVEGHRRTGLSVMQAKVIRDIYERWQTNQEPRIFQGGSPGGGKRR
jgi:hypothetical protein